jgi:hypothetical protein
MSWDILLVNSKTPVDIEADEYPPIPARSEFIAKVNQVFPGVDWSDPALGILDSEDIVAEIDLGDEDDLGYTVLVNVYGGEDPVAALVRLCQKHGWQAFDTSTESYLDLDNPSRESWEHFERGRGNHGA